MRSKVFAEIEETVELALALKVAEKRVEGSGSTVPMTSSGADDELSR